MTSDAIVLLKEEHKELLRLFRSYRSLAAAESADRGDTADRIVHAVTVHTYLEDEVLFPGSASCFRTPRTTPCGTTRSTGPQTGSARRSPRWNPVIPASTTGSPR